MENEMSEPEPRDKSASYLSETTSRFDFRKRRRLEMKKKLGVLHYRRDRLEHELQAIRVALATLDKHIQRDSADF